VDRDDGDRTPAPPHSRPALRVVDPVVSNARFAELVAPLFHLGALRDAGAGDVEDYLHARGLLEAARLDGWAALPRASKQDALVRVLVEGLGEEDFLEAKLVRPRDGRLELVWSEHRLVIPWRDPAGAMVNVQRRLLRAPSGPREPRYVFPSGRRPRHPYGIEQLATVPSDTPIVFVEGAIDVLALRALDAGAGVRRVVLGLPGLDAWQPAWAALARGRTACVAVDGDRAGDDRVEEIAANLFDAKARRVVRLRPKGGKDWAEVLGARRA
jgi:DNA primase